MSLQPQALAQLGIGVDGVSNTLIPAARASATLASIRAQAACG
jgi:hypothetical protein